MSGVFDPREQHDDLDAKLIAGLERLGQALRSMLRDEAQRHGLSPLQLQILIQLGHHGRGRVTAMAERFDVRSPTISDAVRTLIDKGLAERRRSASDRRVGELALTGAGVSVVARAEGWADDLRRLLEPQPLATKRASYALATSLIAALFDEGVISVARLCRTCRFLEIGPATGAPFRCGLLQMDMHEDALRLDCPEHESLEASANGGADRPG